LPAERLQKIIASAGVTSRRKAEELITQGRVTVNGQVITELGTKADLDRDHIKVDGKLLHGAERHTYLLVNKPKGYVTTVSDPEGRPTVMELIKHVGERIYPIGRLDYASEGLLLMTNDGELANFLTRAASHVPKTYLVKVAGLPQEEDVEKLRQGIRIGSKPGAEFMHSVRTAPAQVRLVRESDNPWYEVTLTQGKNRQIRRMFEEIGHHVEKIKRTRYGGIALDVEPGKFRELTEQEIATLRRSGDGKAEAAEPVPEKKLIKANAPYIGKAAPKRRNDDRFRARDDRYPRREARDPRREARDPRREARGDTRGPRPGFAGHVPGGDADAQGERPRTARPRHADSRGERGDYAARPPRERSFGRPPFGERARTGERPSFRNKPRNDRPSFGDRPARNEDERPRRSERPSFGDRPPRGERPERREQRGFGDRPPRRERPAFGDRPPRADSARPYRDRPPRDAEGGEEYPARAPRERSFERPRTGPRPGQGNRPGSGERPRFGARPSSGDRRPRGEGRGLGNRPPRGERPEGRDRPPRSEGRSFGDRPPRRDRPERSDRAPGGDRPPRSEGSFGDRPPRRDRPERSDRAPRGDRPPRSEGRSFGDRPPRRDRPERSDRAPRGDRPPRSASEGRSFGDRPARGAKRPAGKRGDTRGPRRGPRP
jgi:23S rRNA pseudouridine2605 synthase